MKAYLLGSGVPAELPVVAPSTIQTIVLQATNVNFSGDTAVVDGRAESFVAAITEADELVSIGLVANDAGHRDHLRPFFVATEATLEGDA